ERSLVGVRRPRPSPAVVMISGVDDPELGKAALEHGAFASHVKPVGATQLYLLVVNNLRRRSLEIDNRANVDRLEGMIAERAEQMRRAAELQAAMLRASPSKENAFESAAPCTAARDIRGGFHDWYRAATRPSALPLGGGRRRG